MASLYNTFGNCFKIPELKSRILFTAALLAICRVIAFIRVPGLDAEALKTTMEKATSGGAMGMYNLFTGGALEHAAVGALGIMPYISATIIVQLLTAVVPQLSKLAREEGGRAKIIQYGRYLTVGLCLLQGAFIVFGWEKPDESGKNLMLYAPEYIWWYRIQALLVLTTGTMLLMWLGEQITERGIGNGVSLVITIGIVARLPKAVQGLQDMFFPAAGAEPKNLGHAVALILLLVGVIAGVIAVTQAQRKIPVQYAQRAVGRKVYSGGTSFMPLRVNYAGVMPIIFAGAILSFPQQLAARAGTYLDLPFLMKIGRALTEGTFLYLFIYGLMILFFSYFWVATQFNELQIADDLKKNGGYIPGVRPGQATSEFLHHAMTRITLAGALFLTVIAIIPIILTQLMTITPDVAQFFGGTSMLITVGVMLDTMRQVESHLMMRHYDGFLKKGRLRGRF
ncbi:MAG: preprotein translocase subunit SecY [Pedosphaera sp.]|nr:preprotein translocase subunit SecY [Pedosphaera sp.]